MDKKTIVVVGAGTGLGNHIAEEFGRNGFRVILRALAIAMHDELKDDGIYVGIVNIKGNIGSDEYYAPAKIAEKFYQLYTEKKDTEITY